MRIHLIAIGVALCTIAQALAHLGHDVLALMTKFLSQAGAIEKGELLLMKRLE